MAGGTLSERFVWVTLLVCDGNLEHAAPHYAPNPATATFELHIDAIFTG